MTRPLFQLDTLKLAALTFEEAVIIRSVLTLIVPCEHGNYDGHWGPSYTGPNYDGDIQMRNWCPGAAVKEDT